jgi:DNA mismatch endonuclease (patch repair protein)
MADHLSAEKRSWNMSRIHAEDTKPELAVRSFIHRKGYRFRLHDKNLPGKPDIVLKKYKTVIFVHGCFWHQHKGCKRASVPKSNMDYWIPKLEGNKVKDRKNRCLLKRLGWTVIVIWECEAENIKKLKKIIKEIKK